jgi:hypothetical protein
MINASRGNTLIARLTRASNGRNCGFESRRRRAVADSIIGAFGRFVALGSTT